MILECGMLSAARECRMSFALDINGADIFFSLLLSSLCTFLHRSCFLKHLSIQSGSRANTTSLDTVAKAENTVGRPESFVIFKNLLCSTLCWGLIRYSILPISGKEERQR